MAVRRPSFLGLNFWQAVWIAHADPDRLRAELDGLKAAGAQVLRITAASEGESDAPLMAVPTLQPSPGRFDEAMLAALDLVLSELRVRDAASILAPALPAAHWVHTVIGSL